jgi:diguanylate cyclase (GGDEF)-like protein
VLIKNKIMLIGLMIPPDFLDLYKELMVINNYQTNALRIALKEQNLTEISIRSDDALAYEDMSRMNNELISLQREIAKKNLELERLYAEVKEFSITDPLTGLLNRRGFSHRADQEWNHAVRYKRSITAIMFDIDNFKLFNDTYGHAIGDVVLKKVAERSSMQIRNVDILSRYGGEEFCLILPEIPVSKASLVAEKLRKSISKEMETEAGTFYVTISLGLAANKNGETNLGELLENADKAMYHAKQTGRDRICIYPFSR